MVAQLVENRGNESHILSVSLPTSFSCCNVPANAFGLVAGGDARPSPTRLSIAPFLLEGTLYWKALCAARTGNWAVAYIK